MQTAGWGPHVIGGKDNGREIRFMLVRNHERAFVVVRMKFCADSFMNLEGGKRF